MPLHWRAAGLRLAWLQAQAATGDRGVGAGQQANGAGRPWSGVPELIGSCPAACGSGAARAAAWGC